MIKGHGNDIENYDREIIADFSSNIVPGGLNPAIKDHIKHKIDFICNYPQPDAGKLKNEIARHHNVKKEMVLVTNGSTEAFYLLAHLGRGKNTTILTPSFAEYEDACRVFDHSIFFISHQEFLFDNFINANMLWLGNPNNPDGRIYDLEQILCFCTNNPDTLVVIDEAYSSICRKANSAINYLENHTNLIIVRSLTKDFAIPGLRLGYILANTKIIEQINELKMPWSVNALAMEAGMFVLKNYESLLPNIQCLETKSKMFQDKLDELDSIEVLRSECSFFLVKLSDGKACQLKNFLIRHYGLLIRDASNFRGLGDSFIRLAVQKEAHNFLLIKGLKEWYSFIHS